MSSVSWPACNSRNMVRSLVMALTSSSFSVASVLAH